MRFTNSYDHDNKNWMTYCQKKRGYFSILLEMRLQSLKSIV